MALWTRYGADRARTFFAVAQAGIVFDGSRDDLVYGGSGGDDLTAANDPGGDDLYSSGGGPIDIIAYSFRTGGGITVDLPLGRASGGGAGNDRLVGPWDDVHDSIFADILTGNAGANTLVGLAGDDRIEGRAETTSSSGRKGLIFSTAAMGPTRVMTARPF